MILFYEKRFLESRKADGSDEPGPSFPLPPFVEDLGKLVPGSLLVGTKCVLTLETHVEQYGSDCTELFPAWHNGVRAWLRRDTWCPAEGCSGSGIHEEILTFASGLNLFPIGEIFPTQADHE